MSDYQVKDIALADEGAKKIDWAEAHMPVMGLLCEQVSKDKPLDGMRIAGCLHVTKETAVLVKTLRAAGADLAWSGCNPLSTQDDVAAALAKDGIRIYAWHGMNTTEFYECIDRTLEFEPTLTLDDGADLIFRIHDQREDLVEGIHGGSEETTTGVHRLRAMADAGKLKYPIVAVNDSETKWDFDNVYGTGQSSIDGILRATSVLLAGKTFVVAGYGHCGRGCAMRASGMGANVIVTEVIPTRALKAVLDGFRVMPMDEAAKLGDIFITATGMRDIITGRHFESMKDGAIVSNTGHYDVELALTDLPPITEQSREIRTDCEEVTLRNGNRIYVLAKGRLVNLAAAEGHPSEVMDMSFANQLKAMILLAREGRDMKPVVHVLPEEIDQNIALLKLESMGMAIDTLSERQIEYESAFQEGT
ncbi:MAG: adenosylhomocysteinase [Planctomycetota bacterium]|jgi:adenosylhomocysteinase